MRVFDTNSRRALLPTQAPAQQTHSSPSECSSRPLHSSCLLPLAQPPRCLEAPQAPRRKTPHSCSRRAAPPRERRAVPQGRGSSTRRRGQAVRCLFQSRRRCRRQSRALMHRRRCPAGCSPQAPAGRDGSNAGHDEHRTCTRELPRAHARTAPPSPSLSSSSLPSLPARAVSACCNTDTQIRVTVEREGQATSRPCGWRGQSPRMQDAMRLHTHKLDARTV